MDSFCVHNYAARAARGLLRNIHILTFYLECTYDMKVGEMEIEYNNDAVREFMFADRPRCYLLAVPTCPDIDHSGAIIPRVSLVPLLVHLSRQ